MIGPGFAPWCLGLVTVAVVALVAAPIAVAQEVTGNIYGKVVDEQGAPFSGVEVTLTGIGAPLAATTTGSGEFRFLTLSPGEYKVAAALTGFATAESPRMIVGSRQNAEVKLTLKIAGRAESLVVTGESPLLDMRKSNVGINVAKIELEGIPTARDPWAILQWVPGVQMDRVNVAGSETGSQSFFVGKGMPPAQNAWTLDGVDVNQRAGVLGNGSTPSYFDFDSFEEIQVSTGGTDPSTQTAGVQVNLISKRGTNDFHGSARFLMTDDGWVATNTPEELRRQLAAGGSNPASNTVVGTQDYGAEVGGPILRDRLWLWGAFGRAKSDLIVAGDRQHHVGQHHFQVERAALQGQYGIFLLQSCRQGQARP